MHFQFRVMKCRVNLSF